MFSTMNNPPQVLLTHKWQNGYWVSDHKWVDLMRRDKAALIVEAFDTENPELFLILGDWMEDRGEPASEIQRFRHGNWHKQDYEHASITLFWKQIQEFKTHPSMKVFIRLLQANWKHSKFLEWYSKSFHEDERRIYELMLNPTKFDNLFGESRRKHVQQQHWHRSRYTEEEFREICDHAKEVCYYLKKKDDLKAWSELWQDRYFYIQRKPSNQQRAYNPANKYPWRPIKGL